MPNKTPEDATTDELETFLLSHEVPIPASRDDPRYRPLLIERAEILLRIMGRETIRIERQSFLNKLFSKGRKNAQGRAPPTENEYALSLASEPVINRRRNATPRVRKPLEEPEIFVQSEDDFMSEPDYADPPAVDVLENVNRFQNLDINPRPRVFRQVPPPLPPRPNFFPSSSDPSHESNSSSAIEAPRAPYKKRVKRAFEDSQEKQDISMKNIESTKIQNQPNYHSEENASQPVFVQTKSYTSKFTTIFNEATDDIEQYLVALKRWQRLNNISDRIAISVGLQNFKSPELANCIETSLGEEAFTSFSIFCEEVNRMLGRTKNQWLDIFDTVKRKSTDSCYTYFARLQMILRNALGVTKLNSEHERLVVRKFLKSINPTLRGHLESRDEPINFTNCPIIANRIELALGLSRGGTVTEVHNITHGSRANPKPNFRRSQFCHICNKDGSHSTAYCYGNPNSDNFDLEKFKVVSGISKN